jgi:hypothetical protein
MLVINKKHLWLWLIIISGVALGAAYYFYFNAPRGSQVSLPADHNAQQATKTPFQPGYLKSEQKISALPAKSYSSLSQAEKDRLAAKKTADFFVAMIGSYSTAANFKNIINLQPLMTERMRAWSRDFIEHNRTQSGNEPVAVTTRVVKSNLLSAENGKITFEVETIREERRGEEIKKYNQAAEITLLRGEKGWLVDALEWK